MKKKYLISPSILAADFANLGREINAIIEAGADRIHFDVMDNNFVPNLSFGAPVLASLRKAGCEAYMDVHLMTNEVTRMANDFKKAGAQHITFHYEAVTHVDSTIQHIKSLGLSVGIAICPATPVEVLEPILHQLDLVLIMTVNPGFGGQSYIPYCTHKVEKLHHMLKHKKLLDKVQIQVDGGINLDTIRDVVEAGATNFVMGSALFHTNNYKNEISKYREIFDEESVFDFQLLVE